MTLENYLQRTHSPTTVKIYLFEIQHFIRHLGETQAEQATYSDVIGYLAALRERYANAGTINRIVHAIKRYYAYLLETGKRTSHPCRSLTIKDNGRKDIQVQDLLTAEELQKLLQREERYEVLTLRNRVVMSLLVYQALLLKEIAQLTTQDVDLEQGHLHVHAAGKTNERTLTLKADQILLLHRYLSEARPQLMRKPTDGLILTKLGSVEHGEDIHYLVSTFRPLFPTKKLTPMTIRQSVIANLLKEGKDLRIVQVFAGHRNPSTTEKYRQSNLEQLKQALHRYHPLK
jgi:integrase/recombinase XerD